MAEERGMGIADEAGDGDASRQFAVCVCRAEDAAGGADLGQTGLGDVEDPEEFGVPIALVEVE
jgi:hypothetical protein